jgi:hypothetical protein
LGSGHPRPVANWAERLEDRPDGQVTGDRRVGVVPGARHDQVDVHGRRRVWAGTEPPANASSTLTSPFRGVLGCDVSGAIFALEP